MHVAIVENTRITHHGQVGVALHEAGARIGLYRPWADGRLPDITGYDALVVFGGEQSALDDARHPYLGDLARRMAQASAAGQAVLGICLGAQLLARGLGAQNLLGAAPEFGWCGVQMLDAGRDDPLLAGMGAAFPIFQWHSDTFTLPPGARHLATAPGAAVQAFRMGRATWGTQFHFEASRAVVADWAREFRFYMEDAHPGWLEAYPAQAATQGAAADAAGLAIARAFVAQIAP